MKYALRITRDGVSNGVPQYRLTLHEQFTCTCRAAYLAECSCWPPVLHGAQIAGNAAGFIYDYAERWQAGIEEREQGKAIQE